MNKNLIFIVFVVFAGCSPPPEGAQTPAAVAEQPPAEDKPKELDPETQAAYEETIRRHPPSPMLPSRNQDR